MKNAGIYMKKYLSVILLVAMVLSSLTGCGNNQYEAGSVLGKWAYVHEPGETAFVLSEDGKATLDGEKYTYTMDDECIYLKDKNQNEKVLRYVMDEEEMLLYLPYIYTFTSEGDPSELVGIWENLENNWFFEFTDKGTFNEDGYSQGYYISYPEEGIIYLFYNDQYPDTTLFYSINGNEMYLEYPWPMVRPE